MTTGGGCCEKVARIIVEAAAHAGQTDGRVRESRSKTTEINGDQPVLCQLRYAGGNGVGQLGHSGRTVVSEIRHRNIGWAEGNPSIRGQAVMGYAAMPLA